MTIPNSMSRKACLHKGTPAGHIRAPHAHALVLVQAQAHVVARHAAIWSAVTHARIATVAAQVGVALLPCTRLCSAQTWVLCRADACNVSHAALPRLACYPCLKPSHVAQHSPIGSTLAVVTLQGDY